MNNIRLFIENNEIEMVDQILFALNKLFEDINNPTSILNDYSKTIKIPFSLNNNKIFGKIYSPDRLIVNGSTNIGLDFDPYKKLDFRIEWNDSVLMQGYAKLLTIHYSNGVGHYEVTLNGELGKVFQELKKITFVYNADTSNYWIDTKDYWEETIDRDLVYNSWTTNGQTTLNLEPLYIWVINPSTGQRIKSRNPLYRWTDYCGFTPSNTFDNDFKYDTFQYGPLLTETFAAVLDASTFEFDTGFSGETITGDGLLPREIGDFRSYYQQPFIYFNKLFSIFRAKALTVSGYNFVLDSSWFNANNPYWSVYAMTLKKFDVDAGKDRQDYDNNYKMQCGNSPLLKYWNSRPDGTGWPAYTESSDNYLVPNRILNENYPICCDLATVPVAERYYNLVPATNGQVFQVNIPFAIGIDPGTYSIDDFELADDNGLVIEIDASCGTADSSYGMTDVDVKYAKFLIVSPTTTLDPNNYQGYQFLSFENFYDINGQRTFKDAINALIYVNIKYSRVKLRAKCHWLFDHYPIKPLGSYKTSLALYFNIDNINCTVSVQEFVPRSYYKFSLVDLWNNEFNLFDVILKYCKIFRIMITVDDINKTINFTQLKQYFNNYTVEDWTNKLDMSKEYKLEPVHWDFKYINFNYEDSETMLGEKYREKYGVNYGGYKLKTAYNFNDDVKELFKELPCSMTNTDNVLSWNNLYTNHKVIYSYPPTEEFVYSKDDDNKYVDAFGLFYFYSGLKLFDDVLLLRTPVSITDDTDLLITSNTYCYNSGLDYRSCSTYASLKTYRTINNNVYLSVFNVPSEFYTYTNPYTGSISIYNAFWKKYIEEKYSIQNKKLTAYFKLSALDYLNFRFNKFVTILNQLYIVNKIFDFDCTSDEPTKIELLTVLNVNNYIDNNFSY